MQTVELILDPSLSYLIRFHTSQGISIVDVVPDMPVNNNPDDSYFVANNLKTWWMRTAEQITGITIHHTLSDDMMATARYITRPVKQNGKGYPTTQYAYWVTREGIVYKCVSDYWGLIHDHCGFQNHNISIGMAGRWDKAIPPEPELNATAALCRLLRDRYDIASEEITGHQERAGARYPTVCPGWNSAGWRSDLMSRVNNVPSMSFAVQESDDANALE
jgi:hypothetical protein